MKKFAAIIVFLGLIILGASQLSVSFKQRTMPQRVSFQTEDNVTIVGDFYNAGSDSVALLLHMMPATRSSWRTFAQALVKQGISVLAIDLRGHGESLEQGGERLDYLKFEPKSHQASQKDVEAALFWLQNQGFALTRTALVGASIGANLVLQAFGYHPDCPLAIAISPGLDYRGIQPGPFITAYRPEQKLFLIASREDAGSAIAAQEMQKQSSAQTELEMLAGAGHGTQIFESSPETLQKAVAWLKLNFLNK
ncbi:alpha/beta fold hydrolase [Candidatus Parcubacteria bacterium]|jgi:pimeloyl-ACP methyl ester carboxylesterase|nr:MAG: alpha/beta fold hydrolase [Candidatus Parcubacteria bacterium]